MGRPPIGKRPMTPAERKRRHRARSPRAQSEVAEWPCGHTAGVMCAECHQQLAARAHELAEDNERLTDELHRLGQRKFPNLDAMDERDLIVVEQLIEYAQAKREALRARKIGNVKLALAHETKCEELYKQLPKEARWR
jgi:hypothetical protein